MRAHKEVVPQDTEHSRHEQRSRRPTLLDAPAYRTLLAGAHPALRFDAERLGGVPSFVARLDLREPLLPGPIRWALSGVRPVLPGLVTPRSLFLGSPFERYDQTHLLDDVDDVPRLVSQIRDACRAESCAVAVITNVSPTHERLARYRDAGFVALPSFPDSVMTLAETFDQQLLARPQGDRSSVRRNIRKFERAGHTLQRERLTAPIKDALYRAYRPMFDRAKVKWQPHSEDYFEGLGALGEDVYVTTARNPAGEVIGFAVNFDDAGRFQSGRIGVVPAYHRKDAVYFRLLYHLVEEAIAHRAGSISLEPTGYRLKRHLGARQVPLCNLILGQSALWRLLLRTAVPVGRFVLRHLSDEKALERAY